MELDRGTAVVSNGISGIYTITSPSGRFYVGSALSLKRRKRVHWYNLERGKHPNRHLQNAANKYGLDALEFVAILSCKPEDMHHYEQIVFDDRKPEYNIAPIAGSGLGTKRTAEQRARMSAAQKGRVITPEHRAKISARVVSAESREKMAAAKRGRKNSEETKAKRSASQKARNAEKRAAQGSANA